VGLRMPPRMAAALAGFLTVAAPLAPSAQDTSAGVGEWPGHNVDLFNRRYSPLDEIDTRTVGTLRLAWTFEPGGGALNQVTPLVVRGVMYVQTSTDLHAVDPGTGQRLWSAPLEVRSDDSQSLGPARGPTYGGGRVYAYRGSTLYAMDAETGRPVPGFGDNGMLPVVARALHFKYPDRFAAAGSARSLGYRITTPPAYHDGTLYVGVALSEGHIPGGLVIAADASSGAIRWVFNTIPQQPGDEGWELAKDTWGTGARAGGGIWTQPAIDPDLGLVYVNAGNPSPAYEGAARHGMNLFTNSTLALAMKTGRLVWYNQAIHHDLWDWDHVTGPLLFDATRDGRTVRGVAAAGKNCLLYLWHRDTGAPINPIVETVVPTETDVPGEQVWPTQPIPYNARGVPLTPFCATFVNLDDPELARLSRPMYTPYSVSGTVIVAHGGSSFGAPSFSPLTGLLYVSGKNGAISLKVKPVGDTLTAGPHGRGHDENFAELDRLYEAYMVTETLSAYEPVSGEQVWQQVMPARTSIGGSGSLVTAGNVVFQGIEARAFHAFDARTGEELFRYNTPLAIRASPLTYQANGRQYVAIVATNAVLAFALP
jgi:quinoprotein glucose dehydrogenase